MSDIVRIEKDFLYPEPTLLQRLYQYLSRYTAEAVVYDEGFDESYYQYTNGKKVDHAAALADNHKFANIRVSNGLAKDLAFEVAWKSAFDAGMPIMLTHNFIGNANALSQADFCMTSAQACIDEISKVGNVVFWGDFEFDGVTLPISTRQSMATTFLNAVHTHYDVGIYSNIKYWVEMYGNMTPPSFAWLWGAHWTSLAMGSFPSSWNLDNLLEWQYGVWDNYSWAKPIAGNVPDIDKDKWVWKGGSIKTFLNWVEPTPSPCPPHTHPELEKLINSLGQGLTALSGRVTAIEGKVNKIQTFPVALFNPTEASLAYRIGNFNGKDNEMFDFYPSGSSDDIANRIHITNPVKVLVEPAYIGDGGMKGYLVVDNDFLGVTKPTTQIFVDASKGHLSPL